jgi:hypothetical protein
MSRSLSVVLGALLFCSLAHAQSVPHHPPTSPPAAAAAEKVDPSVELGQRVASFCYGHLGKTVGRGECTDLADQALAWAGAQPRSWDASNDDFVWGTLACKWENKRYELGPSGRASNIVLHPGDVIQLRDVKFYHQYAGGYANQEYPHHTAVVEEVSEDGNTCKVFEQNINGKRFVMENTYSLAELASGWLRFYRPIPNA